MPTTLPVIRFERVDTCIPNCLLTVSLGFSGLKISSGRRRRRSERKWRKNIRRSPRQIDIKRFYKESSSSEEERKKTKKAIKKIASPPKVQVLCRLILVWLVVVSFWQRLLGVDSFSFWPGVLFELSGHSRFRAIFKTSDTEVNLLHVFSDRVSRDAKTIKEGGLGKRHPSAAGIHSGEEGEETKQHSRNSQR